MLHRAEEMTSDDYLLSLVSRQQVKSADVRAILGRDLGTSAAFRVCRRMKCGLRTSGQPPGLGVRGKWEPMLRLQLLVSVEIIDGE